MKVDKVGIEIRRWRKRRNLDRVALAERIGMTSANLGRIEAGQQEPRLHSLAAILDELGLSWSEFFGERKVCSHCNGRSAQ